MVGWIWNLGLSLLLAQPPTQPPTQPPVRDEAEVFAEAEKYWADYDEEKVSQLFKQAYEADPRPTYLFARARAEVELGHCDVATELLEAFLATNPPPEQASPARDEMKKCQPEPPPPVPVRKPAEEVQPEPAPQPAAEPTTDASPRRKVDALGATLTGFGAVFVGAGIPLALVGRSRSIDPPRGNNEDDYRRSIQSGRTMIGLGIGLSAVGVGLLVAGIARLSKQKR